MPRWLDEIDPKDLKRRPEPLLEQVKKALKERLEQLQLAAEEQLKGGQLDQREAKKLIAGAISGIRYQPGQIRGEGTYQVITDTRFSRQKLAHLGFREGTDYMRKPLNEFSVQFSVKEEAMYRVLSITRPGAELASV